MKTKIFFIPAILIVLFLTGCGTANITRINLSTGEELKQGERCPENDACITDYNGGDSLPGGGIGRALILEGGECYARYSNGTPVFKQNGDIVRIPCGSRSLAAGFNPGHLDTLGGAAIHATAQIGSTLIQADAIKYKARQEAHSGPGLVIMNSNKQSQGQGQGQSSNPVALSEGGNSASLAVTDTDVGIGVSNTQSSGSSGGCGNNCYDPTQ